MDTSLPLTNMEGRVGSSVGGRVYARLEEFEQPSQQSPPTSTLFELAKWTVSVGGFTLPAGVALHRACMCALAVALLWTTSLAASRSVASAFVTSPSFNAVQRELPQEARPSRTSHEPV